MLLLLLQVCTAWAYEVDAWAPFQLPLPDSTRVANVAFDASLDRAAARVPCDLDLEATRRRLAHEIYRETASRMRVPGRGFIEGMGYGRYSGWLETDPGVHQLRTGTEGIFRDVGPLDSPILHFAGTASTVRLNAIPVGTDKVDHFLATGYLYLRWSRWGADAERAERRGTRTEWWLYGRLTSKSFSFADLEANESGFAFYADLLNPGSVMQRNEQGCVVRVRHFDWADWVQEDWNEFENPSVYGPRVSQAIRKAASEDREAICAAWREQRAHPPPPTAGARTPPQAGPFGLAGFCDP